MNEEPRQTAAVYWRILQACRWAHRHIEHRVETDMVQLFEINILHQEREPGWREHRAAVQAAYMLAGADAAAPMLIARLDGLPKDIVARLIGGVYDRKVNE